MNAPVAESEGGAPPALRRGALAVGLVILLSLGWYLLADRLTPYTDQARIDGYVVGVAPQVAGIVTEVWVRNNQRVKAGERLFQVDPLQYEIALAKAEYDLENALRQVEAGDAGVRAARANLAKAEANLLASQQDTDRLERLREEDPGTISERRLEISRASLASAKAAVRAAEAQIDQAIEQMGGGLGEDNTVLKVARTAVEKARLDVERTVVTASTDGVVTDLRADVGLYAAPGSAVLTLVTLSDIWVRAEFTENNLGRLRVGTPVEVVFDILPGRVFEGRVSSIGLGVGTGPKPPPGTLPTIQNSRDWLRPAQRFPVNVAFDIDQDEALPAQLRIGGQAAVIAYSEGSGALAWLGRLYIRAMAWFAYAY
jgi:multidrug resistance efflux pump